jgi:hypothetical protein
MRLFNILFYCTVFFFMGQSQNIVPQREWVRYGTDGYGWTPGFEGTNVATDPSGDVFLVGQFSDTVYFGNDTIATDTGDAGSFLLAKYDSSGNFKWAKWQDISSPHTGSFGTGVATDGYDNVFITGGMAKDTMQLDSMVIYGPGIFLIKYDTGGKVLWAKTIASGQFVGANAAATDTAGNVVVAGEFGDTIKLGNTVLISGGTNNIFIAKYDANGNNLWAQSAIGNGDDRANAVATDIAGNVYFTGQFKSDILTLGNSRLYMNGGIIKVITAKLNTDGNPVWARSNTGTAPSGGNGVIADSRGNVYSTGSFAQSDIVFGNSTLSLGNEADASFFLVKYDSLGDVVWLKGITDYSVGDVGYSLAVDMNDNIYVTGGTSAGLLTFDGTAVLSDNNLCDPMFILVLDTNGNLLCGEIIGSGGDDNSGICVDRNGDIYIGGDYTCPVIMGYDTAIKPGGGEAGFVAKFVCTNTIGVNAIARVFQSTQIILSPNPATTQTMLTYSLSNPSTNATLIIYDIYGRQITQYKLPQTQTGQQLINTQTLSSGVYLCSLVEDGRVTVTKRLVVEK